MALPDCMASHIYKVRGENFRSNAAQQKRKYRTEKIPTDFYHLFGFFFQQSLFISGLKGIECICVVKCSNNRTAVGWSQTVPNGKIQLQHECRSEWTSFVR